MSIKGFSINGQIQKYDYNALDNLPADSGLSEAAKTALLNCFANVAWINANGQTYYDALEAALQTATAYTVTNTLTGCTTSNDATTVYEGRSYSATITASSGYTLTGATVSITMGGTSVTGYYNNGTISIPNVTGNLVITVTATSEVSSISAVFTQGANVIYDTDSLDTLKQYLVVTATYSDTSTATVASTDYTLSGTLTDGTSTITASYGGKTDAFSVTVTARYTHYDYLTNTRSYSSSANSDYVNTGLTYSPSFSTLNSEFEFMNSNNVSSSCCLIGQGGNFTTSGTGHFIYYARASKGGFSAYVFGTAKQISTITADSAETVNYYFVDGGTSYFEYNSEATNITTVSKSNIPQNAQPLILCGGCKSGDSSTIYGMLGGGKAKLGYVKFSDPSNSNLLYHFIPAYDEKESKWGYHEVVNGVFYPAHTTYLQGGNWS